MRNHPHRTKKRHDCGKKTNHITTREVTLTRCVTIRKTNIVSSPFATPINHTTRTSTSIVIRITTTNAGITTTMNHGIIAASEIIMVSKISATVDNQWDNNWRNPQWREDQPQNLPQTQFEHGDPSTSTPITCFNCNQPGDYPNQCPNNNRGNAPVVNMITVDVQ